MKKIIFYLIFIMCSSFSFSSSWVNWKIDKISNDTIIVSCDISGDINSYMSVEISPFSQYIYSMDGKDYDYNYDLELKVERDIYSDDNNAYYTCEIIKNYETISQYNFTVRKKIYIE